MQFFSIKMMEGIVATSYSAGDKFFIDPAKLLPLARFLPQPKYVDVISSMFFLICIVKYRFSLSVTSQMLNTYLTMRFICYSSLFMVFASSS